LGRTAENALADDQQTSTKKFLMNVFCAAGCKLQHEKYPGSKKYVQAKARQAGTISPFTGAFTSDQ